MYTPTGAEHLAAPEDLFFSTTDLRGVIEQANEVFMRVARSTRAQLMGRPHNVIRHPEMPGGAFKLVWDAIEAGHPVCAYVHNLAGDGSAYWAFATITPIPGGYLSVRCTPTSTAHWRAAETIYGVARQVEEAARQTGASARTAAELGAVAIEDELRRAGFADYGAFIRAAMPAEADARETMPLPVRETAGFVHRTSLTTVATLLERLRGLAHGLATSQQASGNLAGALGAARTSIERFDATLTEMAPLIEARRQESPMLATAGPNLHGQCQQVRSTLDGIARLVDDQGRSRAELRYSVALTEFQTETIGRFLVSVIDGIEDEAASAHATSDLVASLRGVLAGTRRDLDADTGVSSQLVGEIETAAQRLKILDLLLGKFTSLVAALGTDDPLAQHLPTLTESAESLTANLRLLSLTVQRYTQTLADFDADELNALLTLILARTPVRS